MNNYTFSDIYVGVEEAFNVTITELMMKNFEKFTGDINPLHTSLQFANSRGFTKKIVYGMLTASFYSTLIGVYLPGENSLLHEISIIFDKPVYVGDTLTVYGRVNKVLSLFKRVSINATIKNPCYNNCRINEMKGE